MTFREWETGKVFEMMNGSTRFGVKISDRTALMFDTWQLEDIHWNKHVSDIRPVRGRLARTHDNRLCIVHEAKKGVWSAYYVNLTAYATLTDADLDLLPVETGKRRDEVNIILSQLEKTRAKEHKLFELLELELFE